MAGSLAAQLKTLFIGLRLQARWLQTKSQIIEKEYSTKSAWDHFPQPTADDRDKSVSPCCQVNSPYKWKRHQQFGESQKCFKQGLCSGMSEEAGGLVIRSHGGWSVGGASISRTLPWDSLAAPIIIPPINQPLNILTFSYSLFCWPSLLLPAAVNWLANPTRLTSFHRSRLPIVWTWHGRRWFDKGGEKTNWSRVELCFHRNRIWADWVIYP